MMVLKMLLSSRSDSSCRWRGSFFLEQTMHRRKGGGEKKKKKISRNHELVSETITIDWRQQITLDVPFVE